MGVTNEIFATEKIETATWRFTSGRSDPADLAGLPAIDTVQRYRNPLGHRYLYETSELRNRLAAFAERNPPGSRTLLDMQAWTPDLATSIEKLAAFIRLLAPPTPSKDKPGGAPSIARGAAAFREVGCAACHTPTLRTGHSKIAALADKPVDLYSDLLLHDMGPGLADGIPQGRAGPRDFRTAPLWGVGERIYLLHDGRTTDVLEAILMHQGGSAAENDASEANAVVDRFVKLREPEKQDLLNFLRSL